MQKITLIEIFDKIKEADSKKKITILRKYSGKYVEMILECVYKKEIVFNLESGIPNIPSRFKRTSRSSNSLESIIRTLPSFINPRSNREKLQNVWMRKLGILSEDEIIFISLVKDKTLDIGLTLEQLNEFNPARFKLETIDLPGSSGVSENERSAIEASKIIESSSLNEEPSLEEIKEGKAEIVKERKEIFFKRNENDKAIDVLERKVGELDLKLVDLEKKKKDSKNILPKLNEELVKFEEDLKVAEELIGDNEPSPTETASMVMKKDKIKNIEFDIEQHKDMNSKIDSVETDKKEIVKLLKVENRVKQKIDYDESLIDNSEEIIHLKESVNNSKQEYEVSKIKLAKNVVRESHVSNSINELDTEIEDLNKNVSSLDKSRETLISGIEDDKKELAATKVKISNAHINNDDESIKREKPLFDLLNANIVKKEADIVQSKQKINDTLSSITTKKSLKKSLENELTSGSLKDIGNDIEVHEKKVSLIEDQLELNDKKIEFDEGHIKRNDSYIERLKEISKFKENPKIGEKIISLGVDNNIIKNKVNSMKLMKEKMNSEIDINNIEVEILKDKSSINTNKIKIQSIANDITIPTNEKLDKKTAIVESDVDSNKKILENSEKIKIIKSEVEKKNNDILESNKKVIHSEHMKLEIELGALETESSDKSEEISKKSSEIDVTPIEDHAKINDDKRVLKNELIKINLNVGHKRGKKEDSERLLKSLGVEIKKKDIITNSNEVIDDTDETNSNNSLKVDDDVDNVTDDTINKKEVDLNKDIITNSNEVIDDTDETNSNNSLKVDDDVDNVTDDTINKKPTTTETNSDDNKKGS